MENLYEVALAAIKALYSDTSVDVSETRANLMTLQDEIGQLLNSLPEE